MAISANFEYLPNSNDSGPLKVTAKIGHFGPVCLANPLAKCPRTTILASLKTHSARSLIVLQAFIL